MGNAAYLGRLFDSAPVGGAKSPARLGRRRREAMQGGERLENRAMFAAAPMQVGMNVESVVDWSPAWTFTDAGK